MNYEYSYYKELDSTQDQIKRWVEQYPNMPSGKVVVSDFQTKGKGQRGNFWESKRGENLTFSLYLKPQNWPAADSFILSQIVSLALVDVVETHTKESVCIKWPNDIYVADSKIAGILIENSWTGALIDYSIIGIGLNLNQMIFDSPAPNPISLRLLTGGLYDREAVLDHFLERLDYYLSLFTLNEQVASLYTQRLYRFNQWADYQDSISIFRGRIVGVDRQGALQVERQRGEVDCFSFKEIAFKL